MLLLSAILKKSVAIIAVSSDVLFFLTMASKKALPATVVHWPKA
jgi:hypothetical protein